MAIMEGTTSSTSRSPSPASSEISTRPIATTTTTTTTATTAIDQNVSAPQVVQTMLTCEWDDCGERFSDVHGLVDHLENGHIGVHKSSYKCEWATCPRRGLVQTSRFALVSHCRSHTGEKPFVCSVPECDKSFTRSDTLAKHLRQQHNIATPAPTRGGYRKRKRSMSPPLSHPVAPSDTHGHTHGRHASHSPPTHPQETFAPSHYNFANRAYAQSTNLRDSGFNTFRVNPAIHDRPAPSVSSTMKLRSEAVAATGASTGGVGVDMPPREGVPQSEQRDEDAGSVSSGDEDSGKPYNAEAMGGRSKAMVKYLIMKAKYRYVMDAKGLLSDELEALKREEREEWREKEASVDRVLRGLGPHPEQLIHNLDISPNGHLMRGGHGVPPVPPVLLSSQDPSDVKMDGPGPGLGSGSGPGGPPPPPPHVRHDHRMEVDAR